jgi:hypothetical protein
LKYNTVEEFGMDSTYRFRFLIYLAAIMLVMSVCFVYAAPVPSQAPLLFQTAPQHAGFLAVSTGEPTFDPAALRTSIVPMASPVVLQQLQAASHPHHWFHRAKHAIVAPAPTAVQSESSASGLAGRPSPAPSPR